MKVPLVAMHHAYVVTERIQGIQVRMRAGCYMSAGVVLTLQLCD